MSTADLSSGRISQKLETRRQILQTALRLVRSGRNPTMTEVAVAAGLSRPTVYRYFPDMEALLLEAPLDQLTGTPETVLDGLDQATAEDRVVRVQQYLYDLAVQNEAQFRLYLRATMDEWLKRGPEADEPLRAGRRLPMLETALTAHRRVLGPKRFVRLRDALAAMVGLESLIVMRDVCGRPLDEGRAVMAWAVRTLVAATVPASERERRRERRKASAARDRAGRQRARRRRT
jgi:AcrR family transcriptional regulator